MVERKRRRAIFAVLAVFVLLGNCVGPIYEPARLKAVRAESDRLMADYVPDPARPWGELPRSDWPPAIASLRPSEVSVRPGHVLITIAPFMDGGWGYEVARTRDELRMPIECYDALPHDVYWHDPC